MVYQKMSYFLKSLNYRTVILVAFSSLIFLSLGCAEKSDERPLDRSNYPISDAYGLHTLQAFADTNCQGILDLNCEILYTAHFGQKLIEYYNKTQHAVTVCKSNIPLCKNSRFFEDYVRNYGMIY